MIFGILLYPRLDHPTHRSLLFSVLFSIIVFQNILSSENVKFVSSKQTGIIIVEVFNVQLIHFIRAYLFEFCSVNVFLSDLKIIRWIYLFSTVDGPQFVVFFIFRVNTKFLQIKEPEVSVLLVFHEVVLKRVDTLAVGISIVVAVIIILIHKVENDSQDSDFLLVDPKVLKTGLLFNFCVELNVCDVHDGEQHVGQEEREDYAVNKEK